MRARRTVLQVGILGATLWALAPATAWAVSAGCNAVNGGALDLNLGKQLSAPPLISGFDVGDKIILTYTSQGGSVAGFDIADVGPNGATFFSPANPPPGTSVSYTVPAGAMVLSQAAGGVGAFTIIGVCNPINGPAAGTTNSQLLEQVRQ